MSELTFDQAAFDVPPPVAGDPTRFGRRWRLVAAQLFNVWRFGDLELALPSGRGLLTGGNGVGKTTGLEALVPYLLDLNAAKLAAGKARPTSLRSLMVDTGSKKAIGYATLTFAAPDDEPPPTLDQATADTDPADGADLENADQARANEMTYGVRLTYSQTSTPPVRVLPFRVPGRLRDHVRLVGGTEPLPAEAFTAAIETAGGAVFDPDGEEYVADLARRLLRTDAIQLRLLADRLRQLRNPSLLADISVDKAGEALRDCLPGVADEVIVATADALAETDETRAAFTRDAQAAAALNDFSQAWTGHVLMVTGDVLEQVQTATAALRKAQHDARAAVAAEKASRDKHERAQTDAAIAAEEHTELAAQVTALRESDTYREAGRLSDLADTATAKKETARVSLAALAREVSRAKERHEDVLEAAGRLIEQVEDLDARITPVAPGSRPLRAAVQLATRPQPTLAIGPVTLDPGARALVHVDDSIWTTHVAAVHSAAAEQDRKAVAARAAEASYQQVAAADDAADAAHSKLGRIAEELARAFGALQMRSTEADGARDALLEELNNWSTAHPDLCTASATDTDPAVDLEARALSDSVHAIDESTDEVELTGWDTDVLLELRTATPADVGDVVIGFQHAATSRGATGRATKLSKADQFDEQVRLLLEQAGELRARASELRAGTPRDLPRPDWTGSAPGGATGFASALEWQPDVDPAVQRAIETALGAVGVLGAVVTRGGLRRDAHWSLATTGPVVEGNLTELLQAEHGHPLAAVITGVLERIALTDSALDDVPTGPAATVALTVGRDGTFRAGPAAADTHAALVAHPDGTRLQASFTGHIGAAQRHAAARTEAASLDARAQELDQEATSTRAAARACRQVAAAFADAVKAFPRGGALSKAEERRVVAALRVGELDVEHDDAAREHERLAGEASTVRQAWTAETRAHGLPTVLDELVAFRVAADGNAAVLRSLHTEAQRFTAALGKAVADATRATQLSDAVSAAEAQLAHTAAARAGAELEALQAAVGSDVQHVMGELAKLEPLLARAEQEKESLAGHVVQLAVELGQHEVRVGERQLAVELAQPAVAQTRAALRLLLDVPGVGTALLDQTPSVLDDTGLVAQLQAAVQGRRTTPTRTLRERYDAVRAEVAGQWALDPGEDVFVGTATLLTYRLTFKDETYTPVSAASTAQQVAQAAREALESGEENALREFIIGRLPDAISVAWTELHDWVRAVNRKMRNATASSGVGVQVEVRLRDDLADQERTVYELACRTSTADRTDEQTQQVGAALRTLISVADAETMTDRVAAAVDIRDWVDVRYVIERPGKAPERWGRKTGLSGGERRLVVLAPMLAAIAAACERFGPQALRLCVLDEVPAEVDEAGREGLARYVAELDLDLLCTSYLWDGAPGAWDGIDVHELDAGSDGTVLNWHTKVRGPQPYPHPSLA